MTTKFRISVLLCSLLFLSSCSIFEKIRKWDEDLANKHKTDKKDKPIKKDKKVESASTLALRVIDAARDKTGSPYKFGGTTRAGYDCSGLVYVSFEEVGMKLPRTSAEQATVGKEIAFENVKPGDLVFFATKKGESKISHVGIVTEIQDDEIVLFIHAANSGVKEDNLHSPYYKKTFVKATRPFVKN